MGALERSNSNLAALLSKVSFGRLANLCHWEAGNDLNMPKWVIDLSYVRTQRTTRIMDGWTRQLLWSTCTRMEMWPIWNTIWINWPSIMLLRSLWISWPSNTADMVLLCTRIGFRPASLTWRWWKTVWKMLTKPMQAHNQSQYRLKLKQLLQVHNHQPIKASSKKNKMSFFKSILVESLAFVDSSKLKQHVDHALLIDYFSLFNHFLFY